MARKRVAVTCAIFALVAFGLFDAGASDDPPVTRAEAEATRQAAEKGDANAQFDLGIMYEDGDGVPQDYSKAAEWLKKSAEQGNARAQSDLGLLYDNGNGMPQDKNEAIRWYGKAAAQGDDTANNFLKNHVDEFACESDDQCTLVYRCGDGAINKNYSNTVQASSYACAQSSPHNPDAIARCVHHQCQVSSLPLSLNNQEQEFSQLYSCEQKLHQVSPSLGIDLDLHFLNSDLLYILDRKKRELYLFTPYFAGKTDLERDKEGRKINDDDAHVPDNTVSVTGSHAYNIRIPYLPDNGTKGYYYVTVNDSSIRLYNEMSYVNGKVHITHYDPPKLLGAWPHDARANFLDRFLPGPAQDRPDFTNPMPKEAVNGITVTSVTGQTDKGVQYHSLDIEDRLWDKNAADSYSMEARDLLIEDMASRIKGMPKEHAVGQRADCWGHAGCDYTYSEEEVAQERKAHAEALNACKTISDDFHLDIFSPRKSASTAPQIVPKPKLTIVLDGISHYRGKYKVFLKIANAGNVPVSDINLTEVTLNGVASTVLPDNRQLDLLATGSYDPLGFTFPESAGVAGTIVLFKITGNFSTGGILQPTPIDFSVPVHLRTPDDHERFFGSPGNTY